MGNGKYRKDKPWDTEDIDHWKIEPYTHETVETEAFVEESSFVTLFPKYRESYLREVWDDVTKLLDTHGIACQLNLAEGAMTIRTTNKTFDPYIIIKARDLCRLLARSMPLQVAALVLEDGNSCDIIPIGSIISNKERFVRRRQRLLGPSGNTLRALELLTESRIVIQGNTVAVVGPYKSLKTVRRVVIECMNNYHPIYHIKELMIRRELAKDPSKASENWDRYIPKFRPQSKKSKKQHKPQKKEQEEKSLLPNPITPRKIDLQIASGEYFMRKEEEERSKRFSKKASKQRDKAKSTSA